MKCIIAVLFCMVAMVSSFETPSEACLVCIEPLAVGPKQRTKDECEATGKCPALPWTENPDGSNRMPNEAEMTQFKNIVISQPGCGGCVAQIWFPALKQFKDSCGNVCPMHGNGNGNNGNGNGNGKK